MHIPVPEASLKGHVVNRENGGGLIKTGSAPHFHGDEYRYESRLPVIGMHDIRLQVEMLDDF